MILILVGILVAFYTEAFADVPIGRGGRPKPPIGRQRLHYLLVIGAGIPGTVWALLRVVRGRQRNLWE